MTEYEPYLAAEVSDLQSSILWPHTVVPIVRRLLSLALWTPVYTPKVRGCSSQPAAVLQYGYFCTYCDGEGLVLPRPEARGDRVSIYMTPLPLLAQS